MARFRVSLGGVMADIYEPTGNSLGKLALFLYGFPATIAENVVTESLNSLGYHVLAPHYPGTYDSDGLFTPQECVRMLSILDENLALGSHINLKNLRECQLPRSVSAIVGYSFGAFVAIKACQHFKECDRLGLISPALTYGKSPIDMGFTEDGPEFIDYVARSRPHTYRLGGRSDWEAFYRGDLNTQGDGHYRRAVEIGAFIGGRDKSISFQVFQTNYSGFLRSNFGNNAHGRILLNSDAGHSLNEVMQDTELGAFRSLFDR